MAYQSLTFQKRENIGTLQVISPMGAPEKMQRLSEELNECSAEITWNDEIQVVIVTGADEKSFSLETEWTGMISKEEGEEQIRFWSIAEPIARIDKPVIAAINGNAIGQGLELALGCDIRIATEGSHFGLPHIQSGSIPWDGGTQRLSRLVGKGKALEMILHGELIDAREAYRIGLVNRVVPSDQLMAIAMGMAQEMAAKGPTALRYTKEAVYKGMDMTLEQGLRLEADLYLLLHTTKDRTEGIKAFLEKRTPKFEGR